MTMLKFANDSTLSREANTLNRRVTLQNGLGRVEEMASSSLMKFDMVLHM